MCVAVTLAPDSELTAEEVYKMGNANGDGFGIAWAEDGVVHWFKTITYDVDYMTYLIQNLKEFPRFVHFRLSTVGGVRTDLCHPFEIGPQAACQPRGHANKVMMHNGHWFRAGEIYDILKKENALPDDGPWSDTRLAAFLASHDEDWLTTVTGKVATMDGEGNIKLFGSWEDLRAGIKVSNKSWDHNYDYKRTGSGRKWEGWGWSNKNWEQKEAHEKEKKEKEEKEKNGKENQGQKKGAQGKKEEGAGAGSSQNGRSVAVGRQDRQLLASGQQQRPSGPGETGQKVSEKTSEVVCRYDLTPWQNPSTGEWWQVDAEKSTQSDPKLRKLTEAQARAIMEQATTTDS